MASNRPPGATWETYVDALFRQARENGEFDNLPGFGKPIPGLDDPYYDENWWLKQYLAREELSISPDSLRFKAEVVEEFDELWDISAEDEVRQRLMLLNARIYKFNKMPSDGPPVNVGMMDVEKVLESWRQRRGKSP